MPEKNWGQGSEKLNNKIKPSRGGEEKINKTLDRHSFLI